MRGYSALKQGRSGSKIADQRRDFGRIADGSRRDIGGDAFDETGEDAPRADLDHLRDPGSGEEQYTFSPADHLRYLLDQQALDFGRVFDRARR